MPSRKQRRRREKERRHEYEYVYVDEEGEEVEVDRGEAERPKRTERRPQASGGRRPIEPPSWNRVAKRGLLFAPLMFITFSLLGRNESLVVHVQRTVFLLVLFLPFSYVMDSMIYRSYRRRMQKKP